MTSIEMTGKTIEEATQLALDELGVTEDKVDVEILDEGAKGFLGLGQTPAKVKVTLKDAQSASADNQFAPIIVSDTNEDKQEIIEPAKNEEPYREMLPEKTAAEQAETAKTILQSIVDGIGYGGTAIITNVSSDMIHLNIDGGDSGILIGKHGQTINAIQYLISVIINKRQPKRIRVTVDSEGYRTRREDALRNQALFLANKVKESGEEAVLDSLDASERRIIHTTLADDQYVYTYSEGEDPDRHIVISPRK
ncbi:MAG: RNA-binding cell elongation regulator Jag/EloR [Armatimonadota bacterium]